MRRILLMVPVLALCLSLGVDAAISDFSGSWTLDKERSEGLPPGMDQSMKITQKGVRLDVEIKVTTPNGTQTITDTFIADGSEQEYKPPIIGEGSDAKGKRVAKLSADKRSIEVEESAPVDGPGGPDEISVKRKMQLSEDGKTFTVELVFTGPNGVAKSKRVFVKQ